MYEDQSVMGMGDWLITMFISAIPCVGFVMMLVWAFGSSGNENRKNYCRAMLIMSVIGIVISVIGLITMGGFAALMDGGYYY